MKVEDYKLNLFISGYTANNYRVRSVGNTITYLNECGPWPEDFPREPIELAEGALEQFIINVKRLKKWKRKYMDWSILDGRDWKFVIKGPDIDFRSYGYHAFPEDFDEMLEAIRKLIGGREFG